MISVYRLLPLALVATSLSFFSASAAAAGKPKRPSAPPPDEALVTEDDADELSPSDDIDEGQAETVDLPPRPTRPEVRPKRTWLSLSLAGDIAWVSGNNVCTFESQRDNGYTCFRERDSGTLEQYFGAPVYDEGDALSPGPRLRTLRVLLGLDHAVSEHVTVGARLGFAFNGGPKGHNDARGFLPLHLEGRLAYWFGDDVFSKTGLRPYAFVAAGLAQVDSRGRVRVVEDSRPSHQPDNEEEQVLVVYKKMGQGFAGLGAGVLYALTEGQGVVVELKGMMMFPSSGQVLEPSIGYAIGF